MKEVAVLGAGMAGLVAGALLAANGCRVSVFERAAYPGGSAAAYNRGGWRFPTGATIAFGWEAGGLLQELSDALGLSLPFRPLAHPMDVVLADRTIRIMADRQLWEEELRNGFPERVEAVVACWRKLAELAADTAAVTASGAELPVRRAYQLGGLPKLLARKPVRALRLARYALLTVEDLLRQYRLQDYTPFRRLLDLQLVDAAQTDCRHAALLPASLALDIYRRGSFALPGGFGAVAAALQERIEALGGEVRLAEGALALQREGEMWQVRTRRGTFQFAAVVNATGLALGRNVGAATGKPQGERAAGAQDAGAEQQAVADQDTVVRKSVRNGGTPEWGSLRLDAILPMEVARAALERPFPGTGTSDISGSTTTGEEVLEARLPFAYQLEPSVAHARLFGDAHGPVYATVHPAQRRDGSRSAAHVMLTVSVHTPAAAWLGLSKETYRARKEAVLHALWAEVERVLPGAAEAAEVAYVGTPFTYKRYTGKAAVGGYPMTVRHTIVQPRGVYSSGEPGLYLAGETVFPGPGTLSAMLSGRYAARAVLREMGMPE